MISRVANKLGFPLDLASVNEKILDYIDEFPEINFVWIDKSMMIKPSTLKKIKKVNPKIILASVSEDDMYAKHNRNFYYENSLRLYDIVFTTKPYNISELISLGAIKTKLFLDSYSENLHRPILEYEKIENKPFDVTFIGTYEKERSSSLLFLAQQNIKVMVFGNGWEGVKKQQLNNLTIADSAVYGDDYVKLINKSKINLCFLRKINRDQVTSRTMEIVGCGGFLLGERTKRHSELFREGVEAEFFADDRELLKKIQFYLERPSQIEVVAKAGWVRAKEGGYDMKTQTKNIINQIVGPLNDPSVINFKI